MKKTIHSEKSQKLQELLTQARIDAALTQQQLADKLDKPQSFVAKYEGGERRIDVIELIEVCNAMEVDALKLIKQIV